MNIKHIIPLFVIIPLVTAFLISLFRDKIKNLSDLSGLVSSFLLMVLCGISVYIINNLGALNYFIGGWKPPIGINMVLDGLSSFMLVVVNLIAFCIVVYSVNYMQRYTDKWKFWTLFFLMVAGMNGVIITGDIFNLFVYLEIASVASYALVAFGTEKHELEASFKYAVMSTVASLFILLSIAFLYSYTSTLNLADISRTLQVKGNSNIVILVSILFIFGFGLKTALVPFHGWLPDAHPSAPAPISAMLSGILIKALGVYVICRIFFNVIGFNPGISYVLMVLGTLSMVVGGCLALRQWDLKRLLAYSSISQIGYIILGIGLGTPLGILGGLFHLFNHSVFKSLLFLNSGALEYSTGTRDLKEMGGLSKKMPVSSVTGMIASMSVAGMPPFNGFWSKLIIIIALVKADRMGFAIWAVLVSILTLAMYLKVIKFAYYGELKEKFRKINEVPECMKVSMVILSFICILGGVLLLGNIRTGFLKQAADVMLQGTEYATTLLEGIK